MATDPPLTDRIVDALDELRDARLRFDYSPNSDAELMVEHAELKLNELLEQQHTGGS